LFLYRVILIDVLTLLGDILKHHNMSHISFPPTFKDTISFTKRIFV